MGGVGGVWRLPFLLLVSVYAVYGYAACEVLLVSRSSYAHFFLFDEVFLCTRIFYEEGRFYMRTCVARGMKRCNGILLNLERFLFLDTVAFPFSIQWQCQKL